MLGRVSIACVLLCLAVAGPAAADGPGVGTPTVVTLGDSAISGEAGRWAGNTNMAAWRVDALGSTRVLGHAHGRVDPRLPPLQGGAGAHRRRRGEPEPRVLGREDVHRRDRLGRELQARHRLLHRPEGRRPGAGAAGVREDAQREDRRRDDRRQQLRLRRDRRALRDQLGDVAVLVEELLLGRLRHDVALHRDPAGDGDGERARRARARRPGDDERRLRRRASTRSSRRPTGRRSRAARRSATRRAAGRASPSAAAARGTATSTGPTTPSWRP